MRRSQERAGSLHRTPHSELHHRQSRGGTSTHGLSGLWRTDRIPHPRIGRRLPGSRQHDATHAGEGDASQRKRSRRGRARRTGEQLAAFAVESSRRLPERYARDLFVQHVRVSSLHRDAAELRIRRQVDATDEPTVVQGHVWSHELRRASRRTRT